MCEHGYGIIVLVDKVVSLIFTVPVIVVFTFSIIRCFSDIPSINRLSEQNVRDLLALLNHNDREQIKQSAAEIADKYNAAVLFSPGETLVPFMFY